MGTFIVCDRCGKTINIEKTTAMKSDKNQQPRMFDNPLKVGPDIYMRLRQMSRSPIARNTTLAKFILARYPTHTILELVSECRQEFGIKGPSKSSIHRFLKVVQTLFEDVSKGV